MIENHKYTIESDFVQSYLNTFLLRKLASENHSLRSDAEVFNSCVNLNPAAYNLADCSTRRERVEAFLTENEAKVLPLRAALDSCKSEGLLAFSLRRQLETDTSSKLSELNFLNFKLHKAELALEDCVSKNLL